MADEGLQQILDRLDAGNERIRLEFNRNRAFHRMAIERYDRLSRELTDRWEAEARVSREVHREAIDQLRVMRGEIRAQTEAIFRVIDRLDGNGGPRPAT